MSMKRPSLADTMKAVAAQKAVQSSTPQPERKAEEEGGKRYFAATREGMKRITVAVAPDEHKKLKRLAVDAGRSIEDLMREALADLFAKQG
ncbi:ribbon-helix-helix domain-containing protein [Methylosinus sp. KRF6]|uniref:ribbon-helix-helix domain-containing protein n=1 Tax=Methylosinus sp. KRF6 TaxID=2846853 RepID=UPI00209A6522|nr:ribbon-helix-helix domain-containing protein [Methylosinus sp. KRF6]